MNFNVEDYITTWICKCSEFGEQRVMAVDDLDYLPLVMLRHDKIHDAERCLIDNGIDKDEADTVL